MFYIGTAIKAGIQAGGMKDVRQYIHVIYRGMIHDWVYYIIWNVGVRSDFMLPRVDPIGELKRDGLALVCVFFFPPPPQSVKDTTVAVAKTSDS